MYMVGANVVSTLAGIRFVDFVESRIFNPLGMGSSTYSIDEAPDGQISDSWSFGWLIPPWIEEEFVDLVAGLGGVISSAEDLVRYVILDA
jgi:CubicO group peptidase (beta-lactamase class C family)